MPRISAKISANSPSENTAVPAQSSRSGDGSLDSETRVNVSTSAKIPIGTLMKKIDSQLMPSTSTPPISGPTATAAPVTAPQIPIAVPRWLGGNVAAISARPVANMNAPPTPCTARARLSISGVVANPQTAEDTMKIVIPRAKMRRRPY